MPEDPTGDDTEEESESEETPLPTEVIEEAERLTRLVRETVNDDEIEAHRRKRERLLSEYDYTARVREEDRTTLVLYPEEWVEDGTVRTERIDDLGRAVERPLEGSRSGADWGLVAEHNRSLAEAVASEHGEVHGANARALADFASNHCAKVVENLTEREVREFLTEYFPRNAFPSDDQNAVVEESVRLTFGAADKQSPYRH